MSDNRGYKIKGEFVVAEYLVGIDVGGTFTDFVSYNKEGKIIEVWKNPSTPKDPNDGILKGLQRFQNPNEIDNIRLGLMESCTNNFCRNSISNLKTKLKSTLSLIELSFLY